MISASIVISMYNASDEILEFIDKMLFPSLCHNAQNHELILLDDYSPLSAQTDSLVKKFAPKFTRQFSRFVYLKNPKNLGFAGSYNRGIKAAKSPVILIANSDVYFPKKSVARLVATLNSNPYYGIVGPVTNSIIGFQSTKLFPRLKNYTGVETQRIETFARWLSKVMDHGVVPNTGVCGFCLCIKQEVFNTFGLFDTRFRIGGLEDVDFFTRIKQRYLIALDCATFVEHGGIHGSSMSLFRSKDIKNLLHYTILNPFKYAAKWKSWKDFPRNLTIGLGQYFIGFNTITPYIISNAKTKGLWNQDILPSDYFVRANYLYSTVRAQASRVSDYLFSE